MRQGGGSGCCKKKVRSLLCHLTTPLQAFGSLVRNCCQKMFCRAGLSLSEKKEKGRKRFVTPTETNLHGDALCFMVKAWTKHKTTEA